MLHLCLSLWTLSAALAAPIEVLDPGTIAPIDTAVPALDPGQRPTGEVVGGHAVDSGAWPDVALVWLGDGLCSGTLIDPRWVLTAGHCVYGDGASPQQIIVGATSFADLQRSLAPPIEARDVADAIAHPIYRKSQYGHDIALVKLAEPITDITPSVIGRDCIVKDDLRVGADVSVVGWGSTTVGGDDMNYRLNAGKTEIQTPDCDARTVDGMFTGCDPDSRPGGELGAGGNGIDACFGDSGGPLYLRTDEGSWLVGVTSRAYAGVPQDEPCGHGGIYTRPDAVIDWIEHTIGKKLPRPVCTDAPSATADPVVAHAGHDAPVTLHVTDPDGATYTVDVKTPPAHGTIEIDGEQVVYVPEAGFEGADPFVLTITDDGSEAWPDNPHASVDVAVDATVTKGCGCATGSGPVGWLGSVGVLAIAVGRRRRGGR